MDVERKLNNSLRGQDNGTLFKQSPYKSLSVSLKEILSFSLATVLCNVQKDMGHHAVINLQYKSILYFNRQLPVCYYIITGEVRVSLNFINK